MQKKYFWVLFFLFPFSFLTHGQGETSNWYFGNRAGIQFNSDGSVTALNDSQLNTFEGCASLSDASGNLLMYTDGIIVFDRNHEIMQNGTGLFGDPSSTQSAIIVQKPDDPNIIYIFTVDTSISENDPDRGLNYSVVDITLNNGNGAVTQKNINLLTEFSEKISAVVKDCKDKSIWVVGLGTKDISPEVSFLDTYFAYEVNATGVVTTPVTSTFDDLRVQDARGYLKFSPDGTRLASANGRSGLYIYDFDATTGILTNQQRLTLDAGNNFPYGIEFSPNQRFLYALASNDAPAGEEGVHSSSIIQFDLNAPDISASRVEIDKRDAYRGALQLGQNGKIYRTIADNYFRGTSYLGVIENPNEKGVAATYVHDAIFLGSGVATQGLPPFIQSFFDRIELIRNADGTTSTSLDVCEGEQFVLEADVFPNAIYNWQKDGAPISNSGAILVVDPSVPDDSGRYSLEIILDDPDACPLIGEAFISVNPIPEAPPLQLTQCDVLINEPEDGVTLFNLEQVIFSDDYSFSFFETPSDLTNASPILNPERYENSTAFNQTIYYQITDSNGCQNSGELTLGVQSITIMPEDELRLYGCDDDPTDNLLEGTFDLDLFKEQNYPNDNVYLYATLEDVLLETNPLDASLFSSSTFIYARVESDNDCQDVDLIELVVNPTPLVEFEPEFIWCTDGPPLVLNGPVGFDTYSWFFTEGTSQNEIANVQNVQITNVGTYVLQVGYEYNTQDGLFTCYNETSFEILPSNIAFIEDILIEDITDNNKVEILTSGDGDYEYSINGFTFQDEPLFENVEPGFLTVFVRDKNGCGIREELISVIGYPKFFSPNGDGVNDVWQIIGANDEFQSQSMISIFDRYGRLMAQVSTRTEGWDGTFNNRPLPASDYWFKVDLEDGRVFKGHFTLKR